MSDDAFIVILAYPEVVVRVANGEFISRLWPLIGVGGRHKVMAGHSAFLLVSKESSEITYYDFGRYITSNKNGRVRSEETDTEVHIPIKAVHDFTGILNLKEILLFIDNAPEKTHGSGRMVVSVNTEIDYNKALNFIRSLQDRGEVPYGPFLKHGTNCARFVADVLLASTSNVKIKKNLKQTYLITPSPISNVVRGGSSHHKKYEVKHQKIVRYLNNSIFDEYRRSLFSKVSQDIDNRGSVEPDLKLYNSPIGQWLGGVGSGAWFELKELNSSCKKYLLIRRNVAGIIDFQAEFKPTENGFSIKDSFEFQFGSNCKQCFVKQKNRLFRFERKMEYSV